MFHSVIIPTLRRPQVVAETVACLQRQEVPADEIIVSATASEDVPETLHTVPRVRVLTGPRGSSRQRNRGIAALDPRAEVVSFLDDDMEVAPDYLRRLQEGFSRWSDVAVLMGRLIDCPPGASRQDAARLLATPASHDASNSGYRDGGAALGCCINVRRSVLAREQFDERLALYGWLEDFDFITRAKALGRYGTYDACRVIHLGQESGNSSGYRFGFSQVMNPYYLWRKGTVRPREVFVNGWFKALGANAWGSLRGDRRVDRWGRLRGNLLALSFVCRNRIEPEHIEKM